MLKDVLVYSPYRAGYISTVDLPKDLLIRELHMKGKGGFPYSFDRRYEAIESFNIFRGKQRIIKQEEFKISDFLKYSFGLEFETSMGYLPEDICFRDGLIPLRDGSISGLEYSTIVMKKNTGLALLKQQLDTLRKYTAFNKECSLHIHFGNFPLEPDYIYRVYRLCKYFEPAISRLVPPKTFNSAEYKANEKDYCKKLPSFRSFNELYTSLVGRTFFGDLSQPHPNDIRREAKWRIPTRYYWVNFINTICYNVNKTIEFRLLRPTYNFNKILTWIAIFNAILLHAELVKDNSVPNSIKELLYKVYPGDIADYVYEGVCKLEVLKINQVENGDLIGNDIEFENEIFGVDQLWNGIIYQELFHMASL